MFNLSEYCAATEGVAVIESVISWPMLYEALSGVTLTLNAEDGDRRLMAKDELATTELPEAACKFNVTE